MGTLEFEEASSIINSFKLRSVTDTNTLFNRFKLLIDKIKISDTFIDDESDHGIRLVMALIFTLNYNNFPIRYSEYVINQGGGHRYINTNPHLNWAIMSKNIDLVNILISWDKDIVKKYYKDLLPPLSEAVLIYSFEIVKILIENGADVNIKDEIGYTPLFHAVNRNLYYPKENSLRGELPKISFRIIKLLLDNGADPNYSVKNETPLSIVVDEKQKLEEYLVVNPPTGTEKFTLAEQIETRTNYLNNIERIIELLVDYGAVVTLSLKKKLSEQRYKKYTSMEKTRAFGIMISMPMEFQLNTKEKKKIIVTSEYLKNTINEIEYISEKILDECKRHKKVLSVDDLLGFIYIYITHFDTVFANSWNLPRRSTVFRDKVISGRADKSKASGPKRGIGFAASGTSFGASGRAGINSVASPKRGTPRGGRSFAVPRKGTGVGLAAVKAISKTGTGVDKFVFRSTQLPSNRTDIYYKRAIKIEKKSLFFKLQKNIELCGVNDKILNNLCELLNYLVKNYLTHITKDKDMTKIEIKNIKSIIKSKINNICK